MHLRSTRARAHAFALVACCVVGGMACQNKPGAGASSPAAAHHVAVDYRNANAAHGDPSLAESSVPDGEASTRGNPPAAAGVTLQPADVLPIGRPCRVHLRRDALGLSAVAPMSIQHVSPAARATWLEGSIERVTDQWVVIHSAGRPYWVRADVILAVELLQPE